MMKIAHIRGRNPGVRHVVPCEKKVIQQVDIEKKNSISKQKLRRER